MKSIASQRISGIISVFSLVAEDVANVTYVIAQVTVPQACVRDSFCLGIAATGSVQMFYKVSFQTMWSLLRDLPDAVKKTASGIGHPPFLYQGG